MPTIEWRIDFREKFFADDFYCSHSHCDFRVNFYVLLIPIMPLHTNASIHTLAFNRYIRHCGVWHGVCIRVLNWVKNNETGYACNDKANGCSAIESCERKGKSICDNLRANTLLCEGEKKPVNSHVTKANSIFLFHWFSFTSQLLFCMLAVTICWCMALQVLMCMMAVSRHWKERETRLEVDWMNFLYNKDI